MQGKPSEKRGEMKTTLKELKSPRYFFSEKTQILC